jgi:hypothetical protein
MIPEDILSTTPVPAPIVGARDYPITPTLDFEDGGIGISDPSEGLNYQVWKAVIQDTRNVYLEAANTPRFILYAGEGITEISFTFDQNMRPVLVFVEEGRPKMRWYDSSAGEQVVTLLDKNMVNPRVFLDDKRILETGKSDIILGYIRANNLYFRMQRDRFGVEYLLKKKINSLHKIGMNSQLRLQFMINP